MKFKTVSVSVQSNGQIVNIHGISTGAVKVKNRFRDARFNDFRALFDIFIDDTFTEWMPIWVWVIEHPEGLYLIDTGENSKVNDKNYFNSSGIFNKYINTNWFRFKVKENEEIGSQLIKIGIQPEKVENIIMTHLHLDHTDGLSYFKNSKVIVNRREWEKPYGQLPNLFPEWLAPKLIDLNDDVMGFKGKYHTKTMDMASIETLGHTNGHTSILFKTDEYYILFAGDVCYNEDQLLKNRFSGSNINRMEAQKAYYKIRQFCTENKVIFLPTHDANSAIRLTEKIITKP